MIFNPIKCILFNNRKLAKHISTKSNNLLIFKLFNQHKHHNKAENHP
ncbi:hypothetical protein PLEI_3577 [Photobacterium leiognathi lrivu.4.1]|uniref:Uncharacterized protein n=1 Tax=Photobacterium leiognathi lrivu.4.1 TaxID=1248232 RepID=V5H4E5_PHOLE|nr:hypothetical protein PLEI_3577 [Photobacterium leiognathi lrivu.4.1]